MPPSSAASDAGLPPPAIGADTALQSLTVEVTDPGVVLVSGAGCPSAEQLAAEATDGPLAVWKVSVVLSDYNERSGEIVQPPLASDLAGRTYLAHGAPRVQPDGTWRAELLYSSRAAAEAGAPKIVAECWANSDLPMLRYEPRALFPLEESE